MVINTIYGYNTAGRAGPSGTSVVFALDLDQVSTVVPYQSATRQLTLNDLGTDCPQAEAASVIATAAPDGRCDPILVAPEPVKSWASPCNACGAFGLFDPPYAVPALNGGLVPGPTTTSMTHPESQTTPSAISATDATTTSLAITETYSPKSTPTSTIISETTEATSSNLGSTFSTSETTSSSPEVSSSGLLTTSSSMEATSSELVSTSTQTSSSHTGGTTGSPLMSSSSSISTTATATTASAMKAKVGVVWLTLSFFASAYLL